MRYGLEAVSRHRRQGVEMDRPRDRRGRTHSRLRAREFPGLHHGQRRPGGRCRSRFLIGIPMYSNAAGMIPIVQALLGKGAALGTVLAFMMSVIALSLPEILILRKVLKMRLIATFVGVVGLGILIVGYLFNMII
ncbi:MAG: permease [Desulfobacterales bacterium]|nr:permease [Desulfobacterales bacterium]